MATKTKKKPAPAKPKPIQRQAAQGDLLFTRVEEIPATARPAKPDGARYVVGASDTKGHSHVTDRAKGVRMFDTDEPTIGYLSFADPLTIIHERTYDTHAPVTLEAGKWKIARQEEMTLDGMRRVQD